MSVASINYIIELNSASDIPVVSKLLKEISCKFDICINAGENNFFGDGPYCSNEEFFSFFTQIAKSIPSSAFEGKIEVFKYATEHTTYTASFNNKELKISEILDTTESTVTTEYQEYVESVLPYEKFTELLKIPVVEDISFDSCNSGFDSNAYVDFIFEYFKDGDFENMDFEEFEEICDDFEIPRVEKDTFEVAKSAIKMLKLTEDDFENRNSIEISTNKILRTKIIKIN